MDGMTDNGQKVVAKAHFVNKGELKNHDIRDFVCIQELLSDHIYKIQIIYLL